MLCPLSSKMDAREIATITEAAPGGDHYMSQFLTVIKAGYQMNWVGA